MIRAAEALPIPDGWYAPDFDIRHGTDLLIAVLVVPSGHCCCSSTKELIGIGFGASWARTRKLHCVVADLYVDSNTVVLKCTN